MNTLAAAVARFSERGYTGDFRAEREGLREVSSGRLCRPERLQIDDMARFEGDSDPAAQAVVFALRELDGEARGTYVVAFGPEMDPLDAEAVHQLRGGPPHE